MNATEFHIFLNIMGLQPRNRQYWEDRLKQIIPELANTRQIRAGASVGAYCAEPGNGYCPFYLSARFFDLEQPHELAEYRRVESIVREAVARHITPIA